MNQMKTIQRHQDTTTDPPPQIHVHGDEQCLKISDLVVLSRMTTTASLSCSVSECKNQNLFAMIYVVNLHLQPLMVHLSSKLMGLVWDLIDHQLRNVVPQGPLSMVSSLALALWVEDRVSSLGFGR